MPSTALKIFWIFFLLILFPVLFFYGAQLSWPVWVKGLLLFLLVIIANLGFIGIAHYGFRHGEQPRQEEDD
ncbi:hypothetical protein PT274_05925 [Leuconostocaceae bacterium ESL0958]|nr:hypothetical protein [Leuconostocaceae bacterium ESL0958]